MHKIQRDLVPSHRKIVTDWMLEVKRDLIVFLVLVKLLEVEPNLMYASCPGYRRARMQPPSFSFCSSIP